jgi:uncharacterized damage-inducible protein DinB
MSKARIEELLFVLDQAFDGQTDASLMANLRDVTEREWLWLPPGGGRSIQQIVGHVGGCIYMYENHAFGDGTMTWFDDIVTRYDASQGKSSPSKEEVVAWMREGQQRLRQSIKALDDDELSRTRSRVGEPRETRWIISHMIEHALYHAGEVNHIRALAQGTDKWPY